MSTPQNVVSLTMVPARVWLFARRCRSHDTGLIPALDAPCMFDPYDPLHPDGADDPDELPSAAPAPSWLHDDEPDDEDGWRSDFRLVLEDPA